MHEQPKDIMTLDQANYIVNHYYFDVMNFCGCYTPGEVLNKMEEGLAAFDRDTEKEWKNRTDWVDNNLVLAYLLDSLGLTEHGGSVGGAWLTEKGKKLLVALKTSDDNWENEEFTGWGVQAVREGFKSYEDERDTFLKEWK